MYLRVKIGWVNQHHAVDIAIDGIEGWNFAQAAAYDLILLDLMLPRLHSLRIIRLL
ncbi:DNA ligase [Lyngbya sp. PCC 8106]|uniref:DNA ligase n=1 Tax=Lyngbya sp. (strain PCC 8106) TaxID=313612 RepID=UPI0000EAA2DA|nr:DNA ligase [Lyngbya sp. PCC 8106]EAW36954.1 DNA ligase [Lyngbya sp. PCC 8106]